MGCFSTVMEAFFILLFVFIAFCLLFGLTNYSVPFHSVLCSNISEEDRVEGVQIFMRVDIFVVESPLCQCHQHWFIYCFQKLEILYNVLVGQTCPSNHC